MYLRNCFAMCGLILKSYTFLLIRRVGDALFVEIPKGRVGALEAYGDKLNIPRQRPERIFHWICFVMSGFICQRRTYSLFVCVCVCESAGWKCSFCWVCGKTFPSPLIPVVQTRLSPREKPWRSETICETALRDWMHLTELNLSFDSRVGNTLSLEFAKAYLGAHGGLCWKIKYPPRSSRKKLSVNWLCEMWIHLTELNPCFGSAGWKHFCGRICKRIFGTPLRPMVEKHIFPDNS